MGDEAGKPLSSKASMLRGGTTCCPPSPPKGKWTIHPGRHGQRGTVYRVSGGLIAGRKRPLIVLADTPPSTISKQVRDYVRAHRSQLRVFFLPKRAPNTTRTNRFGTRSRTTASESSREKQGGFEGPPHFRIGFVETKHPAYYFFFPSAGTKYAAGVA